MNIFNRIINDEYDADRRLGNRNIGSPTRRMEIMARMNPNGFRTPAQEPRVVRDGKTRGELKRERRAAMRDAVRAEQRAASDEVVGRLNMVCRLTGMDELPRETFDNRFGSL